MSDWLFDLGNSRLKFAPLLADGPGEVGFIAHDGAHFADDWLARLPTSMRVVHLASVASPKLAGRLQAALRERGAVLEIASTLPVCAGVRIAYAQPCNLGVDRFLALLAAHARGPAATLVVGVGTALTVDLLAADGLHRGGRIAPSPALMREALHARAAQLPASGGDCVAFADDTASALASGCIGAALGLIEHCREAAQRLLSTSLRLLLHGGGAPELQSRLADAELAPALVLEGLACWARRAR